jgi:hypothetical protein
LPAQALAREGLPPPSHSIMLASLVSLRLPQAQQLHGNLSAGRLMRKLPLTSAQFTLCIFD